MEDITENEETECKIAVIRLITVIGKEDDNIGKDLILSLSGNQDT